MVSSEEEEDEEENEGQRPRGDRDRVRVVERGRDAQALEGGGTGEEPLVAGGWAEKAALPRAEA